jgi:hypothetical protein
MTRAVRHGREIDVVTAALSSERALPIASMVPTFDSNVMGVTIKAPVLAVAGTSLIRTMAGVLEDVAWLVLTALLLPLGILLIGTPVALCVRALIEIVHRL